MKKIIFTGYQDTLHRIARLSLTGAFLLYALDSAIPSAIGQRQVTEALAQDEIGIVKTGPGFCTRISFQDDVAEVFCGDLYDPATGKGSFVLQSSGKDVFVKPIATLGVSNLFVKIGKRRSIVFNFELKIVPASQANLIVRVIEPSQAGNSRDGLGAESQKSLIAPAPPLLPMIPPLPVDDLSNLLMTTRSRLVTLTIPDRGLLQAPPLPVSESKETPVATSSAKPH